MITSILKNLNKAACRHRRYSLSAALVCIVTLLGCHPDMWDQPRYAALQANENFADGASSRMPVEGTVLYDAQRRDWIAPAVYHEVTGSDERQVPSILDDRFWTAKEEDGTFVQNNYFEVNQALLNRGKERYTITCAPCHGTLGNADGIITSRGFPAPTSYHIDRLREVEDGYIFDVISHGFGRMYSYAARVQPEDRWAIAAYIRALQFSQNPDTSLLNKEEINKIEAPEIAESHGAEHHHEDGHGAEQDAH